MSSLTSSDFYHPHFSEGEQKLDQLAVVAHQDDAEIIAYSAIQECYQSDHSWFGSITLTSGGGASRGGRYKNCTDDELSVIRQQEQLKAAQLGEYGLCQQWLYPSSEIKKTPESIVTRLADCLVQYQPNIIYSHNPFDKHASHIATLELTLKALKRVQQINHDYQPTLYGVEVWGSLDWVPTKYLTELDCSAMPHLEQALIGLYDSQIDGNKNYHHAVLGRRVANATFNASHSSDHSRALNLSLDLTEVSSGRKTLNEYMCQILSDFQEEKLTTITR